MNETEEFKTSEYVFGIFFFLLARHVSKEVFDRVFDEAQAINQCAPFVDDDYVSEAARTELWRKEPEIATGVGRFVPFQRDAVQYLN